MISKAWTFYSCWHLHSKFYSWETINSKHMLVYLCVHISVHLKKLCSWVCSAHEYKWITTLIKRFRRRMSVSNVCDIFTKCLFCITSFSSLLLSTIQFSCADHVPQWDNLMNLPRKCHYSHTYISLNEISPEYVVPRRFVFNFAIFLHLSFAN